MTEGLTFTLTHATARERALRCVSGAPDGYVVTVLPPKRTREQNALMWTLLTEVSRAKPMGRVHTPDVWKALFMAACGHEVQFLEGLDGNPFPAGFRSSQMTKAQMSELIEFIYAWCAQEGVELTLPPQPESQAA